MCLAQGHNTVMPARLEPTAPWSRVKHSTTELLNSLHAQVSSGTRNDIFEPSSIFFVYASSKCFSKTVGVCRLSEPWLLADVLSTKISWIAHIWASLRKNMS